MSGLLEKTWIVLAVLGGLFAIVVSLLADDWDVASATLFGGIVMLAGVAVRFLNRVTGDVLVALGSLGLVLPFWLVIPPMVAVFLIVLGIYDATKMVGLARAA